MEDRYPLSRHCQSSTISGSVANINLSSPAYQYLITARVQQPRAFKHASFMGWAACEALETDLCIRKMIIGKVHHQTLFLTISVSYSRSPGALLLLSRDSQRPERSKTRRP
ncbi:Hypothetical predicted protein [Xyrichtys novacula]|uniref:Uncharacterized protein n=1 Tax=Xyrichtys novacula TaxID=13765 RepID=A0AAV1G3I8_XYRNO|nr:Hypothetical predicted protein [Xyrichtys novacula]